MNYCKKPCGECPFSKMSLGGWLADYTATELHRIVMNELPFPCHMSHEEDLEWDKVGTSKNPLCAGALMYMKKNAKSPRRQDLAVLVKQININDCDDILSVPEFFEHHALAELKNK